MPPRTASRMATPAPPRYRRRTESRHAATPCRRPRESVAFVIVAPPARRIHRAHGFFTGLAPKLGPASTGCPMRHLTLSLRPAMIALACLLAVAPPVLAEQAVPSI